MAGDNDYVPSILNVTPSCNVKVSGYTPMKPRRWSHPQSSIQGAWSLGTGRGALDALGGVLTAVSVGSGSKSVVFSEN